MLKFVTYLTPCKHQISHPTRCFRRRFVDYVAGYREVGKFCVEHFGWAGDEKYKKLLKEELGGRRKRRAPGHSTPSVATPSPILAQKKKARKKKEIVVKKEKKMAQKVSCSNE